ncbi:MAG TPA: DMT family transporter [Clostridiales bacterium]|nr:DMT family transporter [Clostridiales bacterium]
MGSGILAGVTWALETVIIGIALSMAPFVETEQAIFLAPFVSTFLHDFCSAIWSAIYNGVRGNLKNVWKAFKTKSGKFVALAAVIGGPIGMTGYVLTINYMGASIGAVASAIFPAIGAILAYFFLKEKMQWYRWVMLIFTLLGVYGLSYSPQLEIKNFLLGTIGVLMCSFGWGIEAVILAKCMQDPEVKDEYALQIRQTTSALVYGIIILPALRGWKFTVGLFTLDNKWLFLVIVIAAFFATVSYLFYYRAISKIGASKSMALNVTYAAWAIVFQVLISQDVSVLTPTTVICSLVVIVCSIFASADFKEIFGKKLEASA